MQKGHIKKLWLHIWAGDKVKKIFIEMADTHIKREYGLMNRKKMSKNDGMLFKFPHSSYLTFWMKDTYLPLDIAFINDDGRIMQIQEGFPLSTRAIRSSNRCRYALEVNRGWFAENNLGEGAYVGGLGFNKRFAQDAGYTGLDVPMVETTQNPTPDIMLNKSFKEVLRDADVRGRNLIIMYQTKGGIMLPPKVISPPFTFEHDAEGKHDAIVKAWDNQTSGWKSFLIDNIMDLQSQEEIQENPEETQERQERQEEKVEEKDIIGKELI